MYCKFYNDDEIESEEIIRDLKLLVTRMAVEGGGDKLETISVVSSPPRVVEVNIQDDVLASMCLLFYFCKST